MKKSILFLCRFVGVFSFACAVVGGEFHFVFVLVENVGVVELSAKITNYALNVFFAQSRLFFFFFGRESDGFGFFCKFVYSLNVEHIMPPYQCASLLAFVRVV